MHSDRVSTTGSEGRKSSKPIMEKRRRARINASLAELKSLLLEVIKKEGARHSKMEKADILEMAVKHLRQIQRQQYTSGGTDPTLSDKYRLGFNECAQEVSRYLGAADDDDAELRARLLNHLANCITNSDSPSPLSTPSSSPAPVGQVSSSGSAMETSPGNVVTPLTPIPVRAGSKPASVAGFSLAAQGGVGGGPPSAATAILLPTPTTEINNNIATFANNNVVSSTDSSAAVGGGGGAGFRSVGHHVTLATATPSPTSFPTAAAGTKVIGELQVVPPKTAAGEVAFVLPANVMTGGHLHSYIIPVYTSPPPGLHAAANVSLAQAPAAVPVPVMATPQASAATGAAPGLFTLTPGTAGLSQAVLPPSSVGHVVAAGLNGSLAWHPASTVYSSPSSSSSISSSSTVTSVQTASPVPVDPLSMSPSAAMASTSRLVSEGPVPMLTNCSPEKSTEPSLPSSCSARVPFLLGASTPASESEGCCFPAEPSARASLLHSQLARPPPGMEVDRPVWRPWP